MAAIYNSLDALKEITQRRLIIRISFEDEIKRMTRRARLFAFLLSLIAPISPVPVSIELIDKGG